MAFPLGRAPFPHNPIDESGEPVVLIGLSQMRPSKILDAAIYNNAMEQGLFEGYEGPPPRPGSSTWGPPPSEVAGELWDALYKVGHIVGGWYDYGPRYHGPEEWAKYTRWSEVVTFMRYDAATKRFQPASEQPSPQKAGRKPPVPTL